VSGYRKKDENSRAALTGLAGAFTGRNEIVTNPASLPEIGGERSSHPVRQPPCLVTYPITNWKRQRNPVVGAELEKRAAKLIRDYQGWIPTPPRRTKSTGFSKKAQARLLHAARNADPELLMQICLTYHESNPTGKQTKKHLKKLLERLRLNYPCEYLWVLEFQRRGIPHFHLCLTLPFDTPGLHQFIANNWNAIAEPDSGKHLWWHLRKENCIAWSEKGYLSKYLDKANQKKVPEGFEGNRMWAASAGLVPEPEKIDGLIAKAAVRSACKHHESKHRASKYSKIPRTSEKSYTLPDGAIVMRRLLLGEVK